VRIAHTVDIGDMFCYDFFRISNNYFAKQC